MDNQIQNAYDVSSMTKDIADRMQIIQNYRLIGFLDRDNAIKKITELRLTDYEVAKATTAALAVKSVPFSLASDQDIIGELQIQIDILTAKLLGKSTS